MPGRSNRLLRVGQIYWIVVLFTCATPRARADSVVSTTVLTETNNTHGSAFVNTVTGIVVLCDGPTNAALTDCMDPNTRSDTLTFTKETDESGVQFALTTLTSDNRDGADAPADTGIGDGPFGYAINERDCGPEGGLEQCLYQPPQGKPGYFDDGNTRRQYQITSDTPEPSSLLLFGIALLALLGYGWRQRKNAA